MIRKTFSISTITLMLLIAAFLILCSRFLPSVTSSTSLRYEELKNSLSPARRIPEPFTDVQYAYKKWDQHVGCARFVEKHKFTSPAKGILSNASLQGFNGCNHRCEDLQLRHVSVLVSGWTWIPDNLDNLYSCPCGLTCLWTKSSVLADHPDASLYESSTPPFQRRKGDPLRVYMDLEAGRNRVGYEDIFVSYHAEDDVQSTYAGAFFHNGRNYQLATQKNNETLLYWSSSRCLPERNKLAESIMRLIPHHSFGKCLNNVGGENKALKLYPECANEANVKPKWWDHLHCAMSHYKFVLAIENTMAESYVTEKLFYALDSGAVPIYFGAANVWDFVPPNSIIDGRMFGSIEELANYVKDLSSDPVAYGEYHAWRRCGVLGNYGLTRSLSIDTLPCRVCAAVSTKGGRNAPPL